MIIYNQTRLIALAWHGSYTLSTNKKKEKITIYNSYFSIYNPILIFLINLKIFFVDFLKLFSMQALIGDDGYL